MHVIGICGSSGAGKTTLIERLIPLFKAAGQRVSVIKHAHHRFDIDQPGKDSWRHRQAGAYEVLVANSLRMAKIREYEAGHEPTVHEMIAELSDCDWVIVEGFKHMDLPKVEVWREELREKGKQPIYPDDPFVVAVATDVVDMVSAATTRPVIDLAAPDRLVDLLLEQGSRCHYHPEHHV